MSLANKPYLLDSHAFLWLLQEPQKLGFKSKKILEDEKLWVSVATLWELTLKYRKGKLKFSPDWLLDGVNELNIDLLAIKPAHLTAFEGVDIAHKDPFDLMLVLQAKTEGVYLLTADQTLLTLGLEFIINARQ